MALHVFTPADVEVLALSESPDSTLNRQYFRVHIGRNVGRCYIEDPAQLSVGDWKPVVANTLNTTVKAHGRWVFSELCNTPGGLPLNVLPENRTDAAFRVLFRDRPADARDIAVRIAEKARCEVRVGGDNDTADFVFAGRGAEDAREDLEFALGVVLGASWREHVTFPRTSWASDMRP